MNALILFSHGSLLCGSGEALDAHAARLANSGSWDIIAVGYLNYTDPLFAVTAADVVRRGAKRITVAPYFLVPGYFVAKALPQALEPVRTAFPNVEFIVGEPLGCDEALADALWDSALAARGEQSWHDPLHRAAQACRPSPSCPLYGTAACPKVSTITADREAQNA